MPTSDITGRKKQLVAHEARAKALDILSDPSFAENAQRIGFRMKAYGGASEAVELIESSAQFQAAYAGPFFTGPSMNTAHPTERCPLDETFCAIYCIYRI
jgi:hypothetical protein